jgi:hypothetical protein
MNGRGCVKDNKKLECYSPPYNKKAGPIARAGFLKERISKGLFLHFFFLGFVFHSVFLHAAAFFL